MHKRTFMNEYKPFISYSIPYNMLRSYTGKLLFILLLSDPVLPVTAQRITQPFDMNWRFLQGGKQSAEAAAFNDASWRQLNVPYDCSIEGGGIAAVDNGNATSHVSITTKPQPSSK